MPYGPLEPLQPGVNGAPQGGPFPPPGSLRREDRRADPRRDRPDEQLP